MFIRKVSGALAIIIMSANVCFAAPLPSASPSPSPSSAPKPCPSPAAKIFFEPKGVNQKLIDEGLGYGNWFGADKSFTAKDVDGAVEYLTEKLDTNGNGVLDKEDKPEGECPYLDIRILGYSYGGTGALKLSHVLSNQKDSSIYRLAVGTIDPVRVGYGFNAKKYYKKASRVFALMNVYQRNGDNTNEAALKFLNKSTVGSLLGYMFIKMKISLFNLLEDFVTQVGLRVSGSSFNKNLSDVSCIGADNKPFHYIDHHFILLAYPEIFRDYIFGKGEVPRSLPTIKPIEDLELVEDESDLIRALGLSDSLFSYSMDNIEIADEYK